MERKHLKKMVKAIYEAVDKSGITAHIYRDDTYSKVFELRDIAESTAKEFIEDARIIFDDVVERVTCKRYYMSIEDEYTGERYGGGCIVACFAGSVEDPRDRYDVCATWWEE
jgi:hypothetical protein